jgi:Ni/Co efflux regulator RcnB
MKRVLVAGVLGGLLLLGTPTLASSAERDNRKAEKSDRKGDKGDHARKGDRDHRGDRDGHRNRRGHRQYDGYYGGYYGDPYRGGYYRDPYWDGYSGGPRQGQVIVQGLAFNPPEVHSRAGDPVLWLFQDGGIPHTVTADNGSFDSGQKINDEYRLRFHQPGTYSYHCRIHPEMTGRVVIHG